MAIIIAVLIVINSKGDSQQQSPPPTVTNTGSAPAVDFGTGQHLYLNWTDRSEEGTAGLHASLARFEFPR